MWIRVRAVRAGPIANPRAYLFQMANNLVLDRARERRRRAARDLSWSEQAYVRAPGIHTDIQALDPAPAPEQVMVDEEEQKQLERAIAALPEGARRAFCLHKIDGLSHTEVAARLGISRSGVEKHIAVAMKHLRRVLENCGFSDAVTPSPTREGE
jgi:RNA polymerase sigma-70 factor (ECF subfamily)